MLNASLLTGHAPLGIALSGGSDSTALLMLAVKALGAENLRAATVNHGLRIAAAKEAEIAEQLCAQLGVAHDILTLDLKDGGDLQARARSARYGALSSWAKTNDVAAIATGHTKDDVAETFLMRLARGSGVDGLAQMPTHFKRDEMTFLRPLMAASRTELQAMLRRQDITWSEDPSNQDLRFTRVQMRMAQPELDALGLTRDRLSQTAHWMRSASVVLEQAADAWITAHAKTEHGDAVFDRDALSGAPEETACRVLTRALCNISGNSYRPRLSALKEMMSSETATTLHGCLAYRHKGCLRLTREYSAITKPEARWTINGPLSSDHTIAPLGKQGLTQCKNWRETALLPRRSLLASPAIWLDSRLVAAPLAQPDELWVARAVNPLHLAK